MHGTDRASPRHTGSRVIATIAPAALFMPYLGHRPQWLLYHLDL